MPVFFLGSLLWVALFVTAAPGQERLRQSHPLVRDPAAAAAGRPLFVEKCSPCHGPNGEGGHGPSLIGGREIRRASDRQLFDSIKNGLPGTDMPGFPMPEDDRWRMVAFIRSLNAPVAAQPLPGDVQAGSDIFWGRGGCSDCHSIRGQGGVLGPDLTDVAAFRRADQLKQAVLEPGEAVPDGFRAVEATLVDGSKVQGVAKFENNYTLRILDRGGRLHFLQKKKLADINFRKGSLMPGDYAERLSDDDMGNLLAFLSRQSLRKWEQE